MLNFGASKPRVREGPGPPGPPGSEPGGPPHLHASLTMHHGFLRFTSSATPADLLVASMAAKLFSSPYLQTTIGGAQDWDLSCCCLTV